MPDKFSRWHKWPEYTEEDAEKGEDLSALKKEIVEQFGADRIRQSWLKTCAELAKCTETLAEKGTSAIPEVQYEDLFTLSDERKKELKEVGGFVVRGVIDREQADKWFTELKEFVAENRSKLTG